MRLDASRDAGGRGLGVGTTRDVRPQAIRGGARSCRRLRALSLSLFFSLSLALSHTHSHTHTQGGSNRLAVDEERNAVHTPQQVAEVGGGNHPSVGCTGTVQGPDTLCPIYIADYAGIS